MLRCSHITKLICLLLLCMQQYVSAQHPVKHYTVTNSELSQNTIYDVFKDENGFLWLSNADKLQLFDGYRFTDIYPPTAPSEFMGRSRLFRLSAHELLVVTVQHTFYIVNSKTFAWQQLNTEGLKFPATDYISCFMLNNSSDFLLQLDVKLFYIDKTHLKIKPHVLPRSLDGYTPYHTAYAYEAHTSMIMSNSTGTVMKIVNTTTFETEHSIDIKDTIDRCVLLKEGILYRSGSVSCSYKGFSGVQKDWYFNEPILDINACGLADNKLALCINGMICFSDANQVIIPEDFASDHYQRIISKGIVRSMYKDDMGYLWIASNAEGLVQVQLFPKAFNTIRFPSDKFNFISGIQVSRDMRQVWVGTFYGSILKSSLAGDIREDWSEKLRQSGEVPESCINYFDSVGVNECLVIGSYTSAWLIAGDQLVSLTASMTEQLKGRHRSEGVDVRAVVKDKAGCYWISQANGIGHWQWQSRQLHLLEFIPVAESGISGFTCRSEILYFGAANIVYSYTQQEGLKKLLTLPFPARISDLEFDGAGRLWLATDKGIVISDNGKFTQLGLKEGLPNEHVYVIKADRQGYIWGSSNKGLFAVHANNLTVYKFDASDGLQSNEFNTLSFFRHNSGTLFFGGINGISYFDPAYVLKPASSKLVFTELRGNNSLFHRPGAVLPARIKIPYTHSLIELHYSAMNFAFTLGNKYEYRIIENNAEWTDNDTKTDIRLLLSPGTYHIEVRLKNEVQSVQSITLVITPPFYKTWWFYTLIALLLSGLVGAIIFLDQSSKFNRRMSEINAQQKVLEEKERISRDLHDHIGVQANSILYQSELLVLPGAEADSSPEIIRSTAKEMIVNLRDTIWAMQKEAINGQDIDLRLRNFCHMIKQQYRNFEVHFSGTLPENINFKYSAALNIVRICQEAVFNSLKYSGCKSIEIIYKETAGNWMIQIADDGAGFDLQEKLKQDDHFGLGNMMSRARESGIALQIDTAPGKGSIITLNINTAHD